MNRRDTALLDALARRLARQFKSDPECASATISRGEGWAVVKVIRERNGLRAAEVETMEVKGEGL